MAQGYTFTSGSPIPGGREGAERHYKGGKMKNWIIEQVDSRQFPGLDWVDKEKTKFKVPWRHAKKKGYNRERDAALFKEWAVYTGKYAKHSDPTIWKINFRCALNSLKDINECKEEHTETFKVYQILPYPHHRKRVPKKDVLRSVSKHESLASINFGRLPTMPPNPYLPQHIDYSSKFQQPVIPELESQLRDIDIKSQPPSNFTADSPYSDLLMDRPSPYSTPYPLDSHCSDGLYSDIPNIVITPEISDPNSIIDSNLSSNISEAGMGAGFGPVGSNMSDASLQDAYYYNAVNRLNDESLLGLPGYMHLPVSRSKSMDELNTQNLLAFNNFDASNIYKWRSTGNLGGQGPWDMYFPSSAGSSMLSLTPEDFVRIFKSEYLSDSGESNSDYAQSVNNSFPSSNVTLPPCPPHPLTVDMPLPLHSSISVESEPENLYIDVANDSKFAQEADYTFSAYRP